MFKFVLNVWSVVCFLWKYIKPVYTDLMRIIGEVRVSGLDNEAARKKVFQDITDCIQARGLEKVPDSVLNCSIELCYQIYVWQNRKGEQQK
jgi:hypothetical protein